MSLHHDLDADLIPSVVQFTGMVFASLPPEQTLQGLADTLGASSLALYRREGRPTEAQCLARNRKASAPGNLLIAPALQIHSVPLFADGSATDLLVVHAPAFGLSKQQRARIDALAPFLAAAWQARVPAFEFALSKTEEAAQGGILHPSNPYDLTRTERRICALLAKGLRPKSMAKELDVSMPTIRTHLRHIYAKTGLDGMMGVLHKLQAEAPRQEAAA